MCQPLTILSEKNYPSGRHNFLFEFENPQTLFKTIKHIDLYVLFFGELLNNPFPIDGTL